MRIGASWPGGYTCLVYAPNLPPPTTTSTVDPALFQPVSGDGSNQARVFSLFFFGVCVCAFFLSVRALEQRDSRVFGAT